MNSFLLFIIPSMVFFYVGGLTAAIGLVLGVLISWFLFGMIGQENQQRIADKSPVIAAFFGYNKLEEVKEESNDAQQNTATHTVKVIHPKSYTCIPRDAVPVRRKRTSTSTSKKEVSSTVSKETTEPPLSDF
jgi:hypothetical protein